MPKVLFLMPNDDLAAYASEVLADQHSDIFITKGYWTDSIPIVENFLASGGEVVIARAGTAEIIRRTLNIDVMDLPITGFDIIRSVEEARKLGQKIAVVASRKMIDGI